MNKAQEFFLTLSLKELRRRQDFCNEQIEIAYINKNTKALENLRIMENDLTLSILHKEFE